MRTKKRRKIGQGRRECPKCDAIISAGYRECPECGANLRPDSGLANGVAHPATGYMPANRVGKTIATITELPPAEVGKERPGFGSTSLADLPPETQRELIVVEPSTSQLVQEAALFAGRCGSIAEARKLLESLESFMMKVRPA